MSENLLQLVRAEPLVVAIEIAVIWAVVFLAYRFLRGTRGGGAIRFLLLILIASLIVPLLGRDSSLFERLQHLYSRFLAYAAILLAIIFQPELRQAMIRFGQGWSFGRRRGAVRSTAAAVAEASLALGRARFGAIIALERRTQLGGLIETGVEVDAIVSARLLQTIFFPPGPLHDLGVVIRKDRIIAGSVQFPMAEEGVLPHEYGARHRAAVGLSSECDALVVVVSEESGRVVIAESGRLEGPFDAETLERELVRRLAAGREDDEGGAGTGAEGPAPRRRAEDRTDDATAHDAAARSGTPSMGGAS